MKIRVKELESVNELGFRTDGEIEIKKILGGSLHNIGGRSIPF